MHPRVSVITPSFNQGRFIEETIRSVLDQRYAELEFSVFDGGSLDETAQILRSYEAKLSFWRSAKDAGQAAAINEGFRQATGDILCWLNSDDLHLPNTLSTVAALLHERLDEPVVVYGGCELFRHGTTIKELRHALPFSRELLETVDFLDQPSVFWTRKAWDLVGPLDETLNYSFDWEWLLRAASLCLFVPSDAIFSRYRIHDAHKSGTGGIKRWQELCTVVRRHSSPAIVHHYDFLQRNRLAHWWLNKRMRLYLRLRTVLGELADPVANLVSPPFWFLPAGIKRDMLWEISGIRSSQGQKAK